MQVFQRKSAQLQQRASCPELRMSGNEILEMLNITIFFNLLLQLERMHSSQSARASGWANFNISGTRIKCSTREKKTFRNTQTLYTLWEILGWAKKNLIHDILSKWGRGGSCRTSAERGSELSRQPSHWLGEVIEKIWKWNWESETATVQHSVTPQCVAQRGFSQEGSLFIHLTCARSPCNQPDSASNALGQSCGCCQLSFQSFVHPASAPILLQRLGSTHQNLILLP